MAEWVEQESFETLGTVSNLNIHLNLFSTNIQDWNLSVVFF